MIKIKLIKIFPYWLAGLILVCAGQFVAANINLQSRPIAEALANEQAVPQVLGAETSIRGESIEASSSPIIQIKTPDLSEVKAKSFLVFDLATGQQLLEKNSSQKLHIASLTKLITALVTYQNTDLAQSVVLNSRDILNVKPNLDYFAGESIEVSDLFNSMLIGSCNDAALALGNYVSKLMGQPFADLMNQQAQTLGMGDSHFSNPMGFDSAGNYSTAQDLKKLITITQSMAVFKNIGRRTSYQFTSDFGNNYSVAATNTLIKNYLDIEAIKTGFTNEAGGAMATKLEIGGREIVILILNSPNRENDTLKLRDEILHDFNWN